jgi:hypothetical protein
MITLLPVASSTSALGEDSLLHALRDAFRIFHTLFSQGQILGFRVRGGLELSQRFNKVALNAIVAIFKDNVGKLAIF